MKIVRVALDVPLDDAFDFSVEESDPIPLGSLVVVPFGKTRKVGVVVARAARSDVPRERLRPVERRIEDVPPLDAALLETLKFCSTYYHRPLGEVIAASLPPRLRQVKRRRLEAFSAAPPGEPAFASPFALSPEQQEAIARLRDAFGRFAACLLQGVTGSGKTEVYLHAVGEALRRGEQALFLVPEIGLTPQLEAHFRERFPGAALFAAHSHLNEGERARTWLASQSGAAQIVLATRLGVLLPFRSLGVIVVDEEHDASYKQQEGLRYSARDVAVRRAQQLRIPVVLGSATPSLESYENALQGRYMLATLPRRVVGASLPVVRTVDTRAYAPREGLTHALVRALRGRLDKKEQSLVFLNRRGFAPVLYCSACAWHSRCTRCSANLVLHAGEGQLRCHHCGHRERLPPVCPNCGSAEMHPVGEGTQRIEAALAAALPGARIARVDRDAIARRGAMQEVFDRMRTGAVDVLVGTQMLAKGHDYPALTFVGIVGPDGALFSADFRSAERLFALLVQVSGRAGRADRPGEVLIQTAFPSHPLYTAVAEQDYARFAAEALEERRIAGFPPFAHLALLRAESKRPREASAFLERAARLGRRLDARVEIFDPVPASLERKAGYERAQLLVRARSRSTLQPFLGAWTGALRDADRRVRWALDVDPQEL